MTARMTAERDREIREMAALCEAHGRVSGEYRVGCAEAGSALSDLLAELAAVTAERDLAAAELHRLCDAADAHRCGEGIVDIVGASPAHEYAGLIACECDESHGQLCTACVARAQAGAP